MLFDELSQWYGWLQVKQVSIDAIILYHQIFGHDQFEQKKAGPGCSKLTMWLVENVLKFQTLISEISQYFFVEKLEKQKPLIFSTKNFSVLGYKFVKHLTSWPLNELVKLTML